MPTAKKTDAETKKNDEVEVKLHRKKLWNTLRCKSSISSYKNSKKKSY